MFKKIINKAAFTVYNAGWALAIPFLKRHSRIGDGYQQRLLKDKEPGRADIWIQAASGGEAYLALELIKEMSFDTGVNILLTSNTRQGIEILERAVDYVADKNTEIQISFSPFDKPEIMARAVERINPKVMVLIELEMWPGLLRALKEHPCKTIIVNGRLTQKSLNGYLKWPALWRDIAPMKVLAISQEDADRFKQLFGATDVDVMNNIKFDRISLTEKHGGDSDENPLVNLIDTERKTVVLGSVREEEEGAVASVITSLRSNNPDISIWLFPRHMHRVGHWKTRCDELNISWCLRSETDELKTNCDIVLWDRFGELGFAYELADAAFVGGSLAPLGGQNFLEVLATGLVPVTGPSWSNFTWTGEEIIDRGLLCKEDRWETVAERLLHQVNQGQERERVRKEMEDYLSSRQGGTGFALGQIKKLI